MTFAQATPQNAHRYSKLPVNRSPGAARAPTTVIDHPTIQAKLRTDPDRTNYAFDTRRVTGSHLDDPDTVRRFNELDEAQLEEYHQSTHDLRVIEFIEDILAARERDKLAVLRQVVANYAQSRKAGTHMPGGACFAVARERVERATQETAGVSIIEGLDAGQISTFNRLWGVHITPKEEWLKLPEEFRGKGSAGAIAFAGKGNLVDQHGIWSGNLEPGAVIQTWQKKSDFERVKEGKRPRSYGHSFIFIRYVRRRNGAIVGMRIADQGFQSEDTLRKSDYGFWVGANILIAGPRTFVTPRTPDPMLIP